MKLHYRSKCAHAHAPVRLDKQSPAFDRLIENYIRELFEERGISKAAREKLWSKYYQKLSKGLDKGYSPKLKHYDAELGHALKKNVAEFSAFKETSFRKELEANLTENGKFLPWSKFREKAKAISGNYNQRWLETEYHQTIASANMAKKWKRFERNADLYPNLRYQAVNDSRTRQSHKNWDGTILPIDHPWWDNHYPPNDWGCRCDAIQTDDPVTAEVPEGDVKKGFANNPAKSGEVFSEIAYANGLSGKEIEQAGINALAWLHKNSTGKLRHFAEQSIYRLPRAKQFQSLREFNNGKVLKHLLADVQADDYAEVLESAIGFARKGETVEILPIINAVSINKFRSKVFPNYGFKTNPDLRAGAIYLDVKRPQAIKNITGKANEASRKQGAVAVIHCGKLSLDRKVLERRAKAILDDKNPYYKFDKVYFYFEGNIIVFP